MNTTYLKSVWPLFLAGDKQSFSHLFSTCYEPLFLYGTKLSGNTDFTKDILQDFFVNLYNSRNNIGDVKNIKSYLYVSFRRLVLKNIIAQRKLETKNKQAVATNATFELSDEDLHIKQEFIALRRTLIQQILAQLPPREREVIFLKYFSGLATLEIAEVMNISNQSVLNTLQKAFKKIRNKVETEKIMNALAN